MSHSSDYPTRYNLLNAINNGGYNEVREMRKNLGANNGWREFDGKVRAEALMLAARLGRRDIVWELWTEWNCDTPDVLSRFDDERHPIVEAASNGHLDTIKMLEELLVATTEIKNAAFMAALRIGRKDILSHIAGSNAMDFILFIIALPIADFEEVRAYVNRHQTRKNSLPSESGVTSDAH